MAAVDTFERFVCSGWVELDFNNDNGGFGRRIGKFVDEFVAGRMKDTDTQIIGPTPTVLQAIGAPALDIQIDGAMLRKVQ